MQCSLVVRNGPQHTELTTAGGAPSHAVAMLRVGAHEHIRCASRASELCESQHDLCVLCSLCVLCMCAMDCSFVGSLCQTSDVYCI